MSDSLLVGGGKRKRSDKEEADPPSSDEDQLEPNRKRQRITLVTSESTCNDSDDNHTPSMDEESEENNEDYRNFIRMHDPPQDHAKYDSYFEAQHISNFNGIDEDDRKYPDEYDSETPSEMASGIRNSCNQNHPVGRHCSECESRYNVCDDEALLNETLLEDNIDCALIEDDPTELDESEEISEDEIDEDIDDEIEMVHKQRRYRYYPKKKRGRERTKPLICKKMGRIYNKKLASRAARRTTYTWDSREWISRLYSKKHKAKYKDPKFKVKGGIDKLNSTLSEYKENYIEKMDHECPHCGALLFKSELSDHKTEKWNVCCRNGKIQLNPINLPPEELHNLFTKDYRLSKYFQENIVMLNSALAMSSSQIFRKELPHSHGRAPPTFILSGAVYHAAPRLLPESEAAPKQAQIYTFDPAEETSNRLNQGFLGKITSEPKFRQLVKELQELLHRHNWVVKLYKSIFEKYLAGPNIMPQLKLIIHTQVSDRTNLGHYKTFSGPTEKVPLRH